jgi:hypothetical protein
MMRCAEFKDIIYGNELYCKTCGMDLGFNPIKKNHELYCCEDCVKIE